MSKPDVSANSWLSHFESLHAKHTLGTEQNNILQKLTKLEEEIPNNFLDEPISEVEVLSAAKKLKNNKSAYSDRIKNEMLKCSVKILLKLYQKLFNLVLETGNFPDQWCEGLITPIFKSGDKTDPNNYRGICVTSCLSKFLCIILNQRLSKFSIDRNIIHPFQIGFQSGHRTADHIFTLKTIIDKHINQNKKEKLYACFVDFRKARSKFGLQKSLDDLHSWSKKWLMEINLKKTQIMIIEKRKTRKASPKFNLGNRNIAIVQQYCYLGVKLNHNGNFTLALKQLSEKALHALYGIRRQLNFSRLNPKYAIKIFDSIINPILYYTTLKYGGHT